MSVIGRAKCALGIHDYSIEAVLDPRPTHPGTVGIIELRDVEDALDVPVLVCSRCESWTYRPEEDDRTAHIERLDGPE